MGNFSILKITFTNQVIFLVFKMSVRYDDGKEVLLMEKPIYVTGHKNPDSDSICAAICYSHLKNQMGFNTVPVRLSPLNKETSYILDKFHNSCNRPFNLICIDARTLHLLQRTEAIRPVGENRKKH